ncbi:SfnB family sulfur acquisition oxidoreductase [Halomonas sp. SpR8]|uniref:SfnB family sulfur acquisition oxidoreductase n=1 Tax=Halomonas sp. SpR8 TaxID=3050463 RepID=UPI0027E49EF8|nr:SfnB family sulfur acquisition oxidoreductase [Halomonas sp. SpR8]MDQ7730999.1 SfnB family sulfur acquisition oxidoreductase [Halomonas sp. SpR8]
MTEATLISPHASRVGLITSDQQAIATAHTLASRFEPQAAQRDKERLLPWQELDDFTKSGLWAITVPADYGGPELSSDALAQVIAIIAAADGSIAQIPQNHFYALEVLRVGGSEAQKRFFYSEVISGKRLGNALAEIGHKDYKRRTRLYRDASQKWRVNGQKFYCTGALYAHWIPTLVVDEAERQQLVFIPKSAHGVTITDDWDGFGQRLTGSGSVQLENVLVDPLWVVPFTDSFERPTAIGPFAQLMHAAIDLGIAQGAFAATLAFVKQHARPWIDAGVEQASEDPLLIERVGNLSVRLKAAKSLLKRAAGSVAIAQKTPDEDSVAQASINVAEAKVLTTEVSLLASSQLFELSGTGATLDNRQLDRFWRNARTHTLHDPARWKLHAIGNFYLNGQRPPRHGAI